MDQGGDHVGATNVEHMPTMADSGGSEFYRRLTAVSAEHDQRYLAALLAQSVWLDEKMANERIERVLEAGASANSIVDDSSKRTALHVAAIQDRVGVCRTLLQFGANTGLKDTRGWTARKAAFYHGCESTRTFLTQVSGADEAGCSFSDESSDKAEDSSLGRKLLRETIGGDSEAVCATLSDIATTATDAEEKGDDLDFIDGRALLNFTDSAHRSPLCFAALSGRTDIVQALLGAGALVNFWITNDHITPLGLAVCRGHLEVVELLLATKEIRPSDRNACFLHAVFRHDLKCLQRLLESEPHPDRQNLIELAMFQACTVNFPEAVEALWSSGISINSSTWMVRGETPLMRAAAMGHHAAVEVLMRAGASLVGLCDPYGQRHGIVHRAVFGGNLEVLRLLLKQCPRRFLDDRDSHGAMPLHHACQRNQRMVVQALLEAGANKALLDKDGRSAAEVANQRGHSECARYVANFFPSLQHICVSFLSVFLPPPAEQSAASLPMPATLRQLFRRHFVVPWMAAHEETELLRRNSKPHVQHITRRKGSVINFF